MNRAGRCMMAGLMLWSAPLVDNAAAGESRTIENAQALFKRYVDLEHAYDTAVADLYSDDAVIKNKRTYPTGQVRELSMPHHSTSSCFDRPCPSPRPAATVAPT